MTMFNNVYRKTYSFYGQYLQITSVSKKLKQTEVVSLLRIVLVFLSYIEGNF